MTPNIKFHMLSGDRAYAVWYVYNDFDVDMDTIHLLELDLNLIMGSSGEVYAHRSNFPIIMARMFRRSGAWEFTEETDDLSDSDLFRLKVICRNFAFN